MPPMEQIEYKGQLYWVPAEVLAQGREAVVTWWEQLQAEIDAAEPAADETALASDAAQEG